MDKKEFYKKYIPALEKALEMDYICESFYVKGPEHFFCQPEKIEKEMDIYLDKTAGKDDFLDRVGYYFDAKSHNFSEIQGVSINDYKKLIQDEILSYKEKFKIDLL